MNDFEAIYRRHWPDVLRFSIYLCGNVHDAEDLTEEAFLRAWMSPAPIRVGTVKAYLFMIVRNLHRDRLRSARDHDVMDESLRDPGPGPAEAAASRVELDRVLAALQKLPETDRAVLAMATIGEMPYDLIGAAMGLSVSAVKVRIHRTRMKLNALLGSQPER
jgi:RNA polymerase sigma-70 factor (ECF subfamily)